MKPPCSRPTRPNGQRPSLPVYGKQKEPSLARPAPPGRRCALTIWMDVFRVERGVLRKRQGPHQHEAVAAGEDRELPRPGKDDGSVCRGVATPRARRVGNPGLLGSGRRIPEHRSLWQEGPALGMVAAHDSAASLRAERASLLAPPMDLPPVSHRELLEIGAPGHAVGVTRVCSDRGHRPARPKFRQPVVARHEQERIGERPDQRGPIGAHYLREALPPGPALGVEQRLGVIPRARSLGVHPRKRSPEGALGLRKAPKRVQRESFQRTAPPVALTAAARGSSQRVRLIPAPRLPQVDHTLPQDPGVAQGLGCSEHVEQLLPGPRDAGVLGTRIPIAPFVITKAHAPQHLIARAVSQGGGRREPSHTVDLEAALSVVCVSDRRPRTRRDGVHGHLRRDLDREHLGLGRQEQEDQNSGEEAKAQVLSRRRLGGVPPGTPPPNLSIFAK